LVAQGAHASINAVLSASQIFPVDNVRAAFLKVDHELLMLVDDDLYEWITGGVFKKITLSCDSEEELLAIYDKAKNVNLRCSIIKDMGLTEFAEPTYTAVAIGPANGDLIDDITGGLSLF